MNFLERALTTVSRGVAVIRLRPRTKIAMDTDWPALATTDLQVLERWNTETPEANVAAVAQAKIGATWFFEIDDASIPGRIEKETGQTIPRTYRVRSRPGRGHYYWKATAESLALGNIAQPYVKNQDFSVRMDTEYVVAANSLHPQSGLPYEIVSDAPIIECPNWILDWIRTQRVEKKESIVDDGVGSIIEGGRNVRLTSIAGKLRQAGLDHDALEVALLDINQKRCNPPLSTDELSTIVNSICKYPIGKKDLVLIGGRPAGATKSISVVEPEDLIILPRTVYPKFPEWILAGSSIYEGFCRPFCQVNSRYAEFLWLPAMTVLLNYVGTKGVCIPDKNLVTSLFSVLIGRRGKVLKSSSVRDAMSYFEYAGILGHNIHSLNNADGRVLTFTPASPEGLGKEMQRINCKNAIMLFDELSLLTSKAGIDSSSLVPRLCGLYEGDNFQNLVKSKDSFSIPARTYVASLIACSTDKNFTLNWSKLAGNSTGLDDRFIFLLQPEVLKATVPYKHVNTQDGALKTRQLIDKAIKQQRFHISDSYLLDKFASEHEDNNRAEERAEKIALGLAIDLGLEEIDGDCIEKALTFAEYELAVKKFLRTYEASTKEGSHQMDVIFILRNAGGKMSAREFYRTVHPERMGTSLWNSVYLGLVKSGWIKEEGTGVKGDPKMIVLLRVPEEDE